jgi:2,4-dienoyl-CoA reductase-like NADH-dependent reductase (Old Yellow Enzyme family)
MTQQHLLTPFQMGELHLNNRVVLAPMSSSREGTIGECLDG